MFALLFSNFVIASEEFNANINLDNQRWKLLKFTTIKVHASRLRIDLGMGLEQKQFNSPFHGEPAPLHWVPAISNFLLAAGSILFLAYVAVQVRNLSVAVSDSAKLGKAAAKIAAMEKAIAQTSGNQKELNELKSLVTSYFEAQKTKEDSSAKLSSLEKSVDRNVATLQKGVKGRKKKQVEAELKRVKAEGDRQLSVLKEKSRKASTDSKVLYEALKEKIKREPSKSAKRK